MKKSVLALAFAAAAFAGAVNAKTIVYDKDGTHLFIDGRVRSVLYSGKFNKAGNHDSNINNTSRFGVGGKIKLTNGIYGIAYTQWDMSDSKNKDQNDKIKVRDQWIGLDFGEYGKLKLGRFKNQLVHVGALVDDVYEEKGCLAISDERHSGQIAYNYSGYGFEFGIAGQTAVNAANVDFVPKSDYKGGFTTFIAYNTPSVLFGPIRLAVGYGLMKGQHDKDPSHDRGVSGLIGQALDKVQTITASIHWGQKTKTPGFRTGVVYTGIKVDANDYATVSYDKARYNFSYDVDAAAFSIGYTFDCGVTLTSGYQYSKIKFDEGAIGSAEASRIPAMVFWSVHPNFKIFAGASFSIDADKNKTAAIVASEARYKGQDKYTKSTSIDTLDFSEDNYYYTGVIYNF